MMIDTDTIQYLRRDRKYSFIDCIVKIIRGLELIMNGLIDIIKLPLWLMFDFFFRSLYYVFFKRRSSMVGGKDACIKGIKRKVYMIMEGRDDNIVMIDIDDLSELYWDELCKCKRE